MGIRFGIALGINLRDGLTGRMVEFELEDINVVWRLDHEVGNAVRVWLLILRIEIVTADKSDEQG